MRRTSRTCCGMLLPLMASEVSRRKEEARALCIVMMSLQHAACPHRYSMLACRHGKIFYVKAENHADLVSAAGVFGPDSGAAGVCGPSGDTAFDLW